MTRANLMLNLFEQSSKKKRDLSLNFNSLKNRLHSLNTGIEK